MHAVVIYVKYHELPLRQAELDDSDVIGVSKGTWAHRLVSNAVFTRMTDLSMELSARCAEG